MPFGARKWVVRSLVVVVAGCGSSGGSVFDGGVEGAKPSSDATFDSPRISFEGGGKGGGEGGVDAACVTDHAKATPLPTYLVFLMDHSDSMKMDSKWTSCSAALTSFFSSKTTTALSASLTWLPYVGTAKGSVYSCKSTDYEKPAVPMTALPSSAFGTAIAAEPLQNGTPTLAALTGTVEYATTIQKAHAKDKVLIVLATDGIPAGCTGNSVATVAAEATTAFKAGIPTYVIGVGSETTSLDSIAAGGGTKTAFIVSTTDPKTTTKEFEKAIETIQGSLGCDYDIPSPPGGEKIDYTKVNVELTTSGGKEIVLTYSADCSNTDGWHYDDPKNPTQIVLCTGACTKVQASPSSSMNIVFGCETNGMVP
jgi:hypothetical protein